MIPRPWLERWKRFCVRVGNPKYTLAVMIPAMLLITFTAGVGLGSAAATGDLSTTEIEHNLTETHENVTAAFDGDGSGVDGLIQDQARQVSLTMTTLMAFGAGLGYVAPWLQPWAKLLLWLCGTGATVHILATPVYVSEVGR